MVEQLIVSVEENFGRRENGNNVADEVIFAIPVWGINIVSSSAGDTSKGREEEEIKKG